MKTFLIKELFDKKFYFLLLIFCIGISCRGQIPEFQNSENFKLIQLKYTNSSGEEGITEFDFNRKGKLVQGKWKLLNNQRSSINHYVYNNEHQLIKKYRVFSDSITSEQSFSYNRCGYLEQESFDRSDGTTGSVKYIYDDTGNLESADCEGLNGWFEGRIEYGYSKYGILDKAELFDKTQRIGEIIYQYDINGNLKKETWDFNGIWSQTYIYVYFEIPDFTLSTSNPYIINNPYFRLESEYYEYTGAASGPSEYFYTIDGKLEMKTYNRSDGLKTETKYEYDDKGLLTTSVRSYKDGLLTRFTYGYDSLGRMTSRSYVRSDGLTGNEDYFYNKNGYLDKAKLIKMDAWLSGTIQYFYSDDGLMISGIFKGEDNFDADIIFSYDIFQNITKIVWDFSYNKSQVYTYSYRPLYKNLSTTIISLQ